MRRFLGRYGLHTVVLALMLALFVTLSMLSDVPVWLAASIVGRDALIVLGLFVAFAARAPISVRPLFVGKLATALQVVYIAWHLAGLAFGFPSVAPADSYVLAGVTFASVLVYGGVWIKTMRAVWYPDSPRI